jgi:trigger factor
VKAESLIPQALENLQGKSAGAEIVWQVKFDSDYAIEFLAGKEAKYTVKLLEVHSRVKPKFDDELAKKMGAESAAELKDSMSKKLLEEKQNAHSNEQLKVVQDLLAESFDCSLPPNILKNATAQFKHHLLHEKGVNHDCGHEHDHKHGEDCGHSEEEVKKDAELAEEAATLARKNLKMKFLLPKIAETEAVAVDDQELYYQCFMMARQYNMEIDEFVKIARKNGYLREMADDLLANKTLLKIVELNSAVEN